MATSLPRSLGAALALGDGRHGWQVLVVYKVGQLNVLGTSAALGIALLLLLLTIITYCTIHYICYMLHVSVYYMSWAAHQAGRPGSTTAPQRASEPNKKPAKVARRRISCS